MGYIVVTHYQSTPIKSSATSLYLFLLVSFLPSLLQEINLNLFIIREKLNGFYFGGIIFVLFGVEEKGENRI